MCKGAYCAQLVDKNVPSAKNHQVHASHRSGISKSCQVRSTDPESNHYGRLGLGMTADYSTIRDATRERGIRISVVNLEMMHGFAQPSWQSRRSKCHEPVFILSNIFFLDDFVF